MSFSTLVFQIVSTYLRCQLIFLFNHLKEKNNIYFPSSFKGSINSSAQHTRDAITTIDVYASTQQLCVSGS